MDTYFFRNIARTNIPIYINIYIHERATKIQYPDGICSFGR